MTQPVANGGGWKFRALSKEFVVLYFSLTIMCAPIADDDNSQLTIGDSALSTKRRTVLDILT